MSNMTEKEKNTFLNQVEDITSKIYEITEQAYQKNILINTLQETILSQKKKISELEKQIEDQKFSEDNYNRFSVIKQQSRELRDKDILIQKLERENSKLTAKLNTKSDIKSDTKSDTNSLINDEDDRCNKTNTNTITYVDNIYVSANENSVNNTHVTNGDGENGTDNDTFKENDNADTNINSGEEQQDVNEKDNEPEVKKERKKKKTDTKKVDHAKKKKKKDGHDKKKKKIKTYTNDS